jgi:aspartate/methionine/tyrosine aminotransferase
MNTSANTSSPAIKEYYFATLQRRKQELLSQGRSIADLSIGNPDLQPPKQVISKVCEYFKREGVHGYQSNAGDTLLRKSILNWYNRFFGVTVGSVNSVLPFHGSRQAIVQLSQVFLNQGDSILAPDPGYPSYKFAARLNGAGTLTYSLSRENGYQPDTEQIKDLIEPTTRILWINYPHMPTGVTAQQKTLNQLVDIARENHILIIHDHAYALISNPNPISIFNIEGAMDVALEINSMSKNYNMAGWRVGFVTGSESHIQKILSLKSNLDSGMALPVQLAVADALQTEQAWVDNNNLIYDERRKKATELAEKLGGKVAGGESGLFLWVEMPETNLTSKEYVSKLMQEKGVILAPGSLFGEEGEGYLRISLCADVSVFDQAIHQISNIN